MIKNGWGKKIKERDILNGAWRHVEFMFRHIWGWKRPFVIKFSDHLSTRHVSTRPSIWNKALAIAGETWEVHIYMRYGSVLQWIYSTCWVERGCKLNVQQRDLLCWMHWNDKLNCICLLCFIALVLKKRKKTYHMFKVGFRCFFFFPIDN